MENTTPKMVGELDVPERLISVAARLALVQRLTTTAIGDYKDTYIYKKHLIFTYTYSRY